MHQMWPCGIYGGHCSILVIFWTIVINSQWLCDLYIICCYTLLVPDDSSFEIHGCTCSWLWFAVCVLWSWVNTEMENVMTCGLTSSMWTLVKSIWQSLFLRSKMNPSALTRRQATLQPLRYGQYPPHMFISLDRIILHVIYPLIGYCTYWGYLWVY